MKKLTTGFFMCWGMFCIIPNPCKKWDETLYPYMLVSLPLLGLLLGALWALAARLFSLAAAPPLLGAAVLAAFPGVITGFIHLDGYMDCADAILSRRDMTARRKILKDPHVGSFAVICLVLLALLSTALFFEGVPERCELCLLFIPSVSRSVAAFSVLSFQPLETSGYSVMYSGTRKRRFSVACAVFAVVLALVSVLFSGFRGLCAAASLFGTLFAALWGRRQLGGMSGDISGAAITIGELCGVAVLTLV